MLGSDDQRWFIPCTVICNTSEKDKVLLFTSSKEFKLLVRIFNTPYTYKIVHISLGFPLMVRKFNI